MEAMKAKDTVRLGALRNAKKYIIEAKTAGPEIAELPDADVLKIISKLAKQTSRPRSWHRSPSTRSSCPGSLRPKSWRPRSGP